MKNIKIVCIILIILFACFYVILGERPTGKQNSTQSEAVIKGGLLDERIPIDEEAIEDSKYYDSLNEASKERTLSLDAEIDYMCNIDEIIFKMESDNYVTIYYRSIKNENLECFSLAKFKKKVFDGTTKYAFLTSSFCETEKGSWTIGKFEEHLRQVLILLDYDRDMSVYPGEKRFIWGDTQSEKIFNLKIEGQEPTEIISFECFGEQRYFWYYDDLQSDKSGNLLNYTFE